MIQHNLDQAFLDQVADFILKNAEGINITQGYQDPLTGGHRYTPGNQSNTTSGYVDPFTGAGAYRPTGTPSTYTTSGDPFTSTTQSNPKLLPIVSKLFITIVYACTDDLDLDWLFDIKTSSSRCRSQEDCCIEQ